MHNSIEKTRAIFGGRVRQIIEAKAISQDDLAKAIGSTPATISKLVKGKVSPSLKMLVAIGTALGVPCWVLLLD